MHVLIAVGVLMLLIATWALNSWIRLGGFNKWLRRRRAAAGKQDNWLTRPIYPPLNDERDKNKRGL